MPPVVTVTSVAYCPSDHHGKACCSHVTLGMVVSGVESLSIGGSAAVTVGARGNHFIPCCGDNTFQVVEGSATVFVADLPLAFVGARTRHCGGDGVLVSGVNNVIIGSGSPSSLLAVASLVPMTVPEFFKDLLKTAPLSALREWACDRDVNKDNPACDVPEPPPIPFKPGPPPGGPHPSPGSDKPPWWKDRDTYNPLTDNWKNPLFWAGGGKFKAPLKGGIKGGEKAGKWLWKKIPGH